MQKKRTKLEQRKKLKPADKEELDTFFGAATSEDESMVSRLIENKTTKKGSKKELSQFKINIPAKFVDRLKLNKDDYEVVFTITKKRIDGVWERTLKAEVVKKK